MKNSGTDRYSRVLLDTSAYSWMRKGHPELKELLAGADVVLLTATVLGELEGGFVLGNHTRENRRALADFLAESFVAVLPVTPSVARRYGELFAQLRKAGTPVPTNDIWIAAAAVDCGGHVVTFDGHFAEFSGVSSTILD